MYKNKNKMNKKGALVLRDLFFIMVMFGAVMILISLFVYSMSDEYSNTNMRSEYSSNGIGGLGSSLFDDNLTSDSQSMREITVSGSGNESESVISSLTSSTGIITGAGKILKTVWNIPSYIGNSIRVISSALGLPTEISNAIGMTINFIVYAILIFVIISALLKGGKV